MIREIIFFVLSNFTLELLVLGFVIAGISIYRQKGERTRESIFEPLLAHYCLWSVGVMYLYNFVLHVFFAEMTAGFIGWANSPFQYEVGFASLGFGVVGVLAFRQDWGLRLAAIVGPACFLWGAAIGHVYQMVKHHNFAPGNAGVVFWTDWILPVVGIVLFIGRYGRRRLERHPDLR